MCKCCILCLESMWWSCCEERFCWDESIALYQDWEGDAEKGGGFHNGSASMDSLPVTSQPHLHNNNHLQYLPHEDTHREVLVEVPILAPNIYQVFANSMIFKDDKSLKHFENEENIRNNNNNTEIENGYYRGSIGKVVSFGDGNIEKKEEEINKLDNKLTDFQIMFQDELYPEHAIFKIDEEEEDEPKSPSTPEDNGISMRALPEEEPKLADSPLNAVENIQEKTPENMAKILLRDDSSKKMMLRQDSSKSICDGRTTPSMNLPRSSSALNLPRNESVKSFGRVNSRQDLLKRVESMKNLESKNIKNVLARLSEQSASFLSVPDLNDSQQKTASKNDEVFTVSSTMENLNGRHGLISQMPDTPVIKGHHFPRFFDTTPEIGVYKPKTTLHSIVKTPDVIFPESDFTMPRYYGRHIASPVLKANSEPKVHTSKSMPDLNEALTGRVSKRLVKIRSRLKPLVIKKHDSDSSRSHHDLHKF